MNSNDITSEMLDFVVFAMIGIVLLSLFCSFLPLWAAMIISLITLTGLLKFLTTLNRKRLKTQWDKYHHFNR